MKVCVSFVLKYSVPQLHVIDCLFVCHFFLKYLPRTPLSLTSNPSVSLLFSGPFRPTLCAHNAVVLRFYTWDRPKPPTDVPWLSELTQLKEIRSDAESIGALPEDMGRLSDLSKRIRTHAAPNLIECGNALSPSNTQILLKCIW